MAINNVYNQTPKRIYTNKPFVKGMNYTNADMGEYVCKAVANLDLESSNTATKLRSGTKNEFISHYKLIKFYTKLVIFKNTISESDYINGRIPARINMSDNSLGISIFNESSKTENSFYEYIINTNTELVWNGSSINTPDNYLISTEGSKILVLTLDDGTIPHVIYSNDYSLTFFGVIVNNGVVIYKGLVKLYFHAALQKAIIETVNPTTVDPVDVNSYGTNLTLKNPLLFRDYVYFTIDKDYYSQSGLTSEAADKSITNISTVMIYDSPVVYDHMMNLTQGSTANIIKGVDKTQNEYMYVRPYCAIPKGNFVLATSVHTDSGDMYYNFQTNQFEYPDRSEDKKEALKVTKEVSANSRFISNESIYNPMYSVEGIKLDSTLVDVKEIIEQSAFDFKVNDAEYYTIISDDTIMTLEGIKFEMYKLIANSETTTIKLDELANNYSAENPYKIPVYFKAVSKRSIYYETTDPAFFDQFAWNRGMGSYLRNNLDTFLSQINNVATEESPVNITNFVNAEMQIYLLNRKIHCSLVVKPVLNDSGDIAHPELVKFATSFGRRENAEETGSGGLDDMVAIWSELNNPESDVEFVLSSVSFHPSYKSYNAIDIYQTNYDDIVEENYYKVFSNFTISVNELLSVIESKYAKHIKLLSDTTSLNIPIISSAFNNKYISNNSVSLKVHLISTREVLGNGYSYLEGNVTIANTSYINTYKHEVLKYDSIRENNNPLLATRILNHLGHYVVYGDHTGSNVLYYSYFQDISYFPSMYTIEFTSPIVHVHNHQSSLVVFTEDDIYLLYNGNVPSTITDDGSEIPFTVKLIQSNTRIGKDNIRTVRSIGKDVFFISNNNIGYLLKSNKYVNDASDTYLVNTTTAIGDLLKNPYEYALERYKCYFPEYVLDTSKPAFKMAPIMRGNLLSFNKNLYTKLTIKDAGYVSGQIIDGDTIHFKDVNGRVTAYRLAYVDTPEINHNNVGKSERLATQARNALQHMYQSMVNPAFIIPVNNNTDKYGRTIAYLIDDNGADGFIANLELIRSGLTKIAFEDPNASNIIFNTNMLSKHIIDAAEEAQYYARGIYNNTDYGILDTVETAIEGYNTRYNNLYVYTNNSNIYIIQSVILNNEAAMTIIYKYNIDTRVWITYDLPYPLFPVDSASDSNYEGFKLYCNNTYKNSQVISSIFTFVNNKITDDTQISFNRYPTTIVNDRGMVISTLRWMNVYFDTGNQSLALMNEKLFREFKLSLGTTVDKELDIDYNIKFYVDERPIPFNSHHKGSQEIYEGGYKKITFFTPARGRIPRFTFTADCRSDLNILQYAIVYLQLNAK